VAIKDLITKGTMHAYRRMWIKRLQTDGTYETDWFEITWYVVTWGIYHQSYGDNVYYGDYQIDNVEIALNNANRIFNDQNDSRSIFYKFKTRYRTKFKIEIGLYEDDNTETTGQTFYGILFAEPINSDDNIIFFDVASLIKVFQLYPAKGISQASGTTAQFIDRLVKKTQGGIRLFDSFIEGINDAAKYQIDTTNAKTISSPSIADDDSVWDKIKEYASFQNAIPYINDDGNFILDPRDEGVSFTWKFNGAGNFYDNDYGINISKIISQIDGFTQSWNRVTIEYNQDNYYTAEDSWIKGDLSVQDLYGERTYSIRALDLDLSEATAIADDLQTKLKTPKRRWQMETTLIPHLKLNDLVQINYIGESTVINPFRVGVSLIAPSRTADTSIYDPIGGYTGSISLKEVSAKIIGKTIDYDLPDLIGPCTYLLQEI
jgi:hypothetical protein